MLSRSGRTGGRYPGPLCHGCRAGGNLPGSKRGGRRLDLAVGITLGALIGVAVIVAFVFFGSEGTIDAPRISGVDTGKPAPAPKSKPASKPRNLPAIPVVRVIGGAPPPAGPVRLRFQRGERIRFRIDTDAPVGIEVPGYGIAETVESGTVVSFKADRAGQFAVVVAASHIGIADLRISP